MKVLINADDFGFTKGNTYGIIEGHRNGIVTSTSMMCNMFAFDLGIELAKQNPSLGVGIHIVLTAGKPLCKDVKTIVDENGNFYPFSQFESHFPEMDITEIERELTAQIERFIASGLYPTHFDNHHPIEKLILPIELKLAKKYKVPLRHHNHGLSEQYGTVKTLDAHYGDFYDDNATYDVLKELIVKEIDTDKTVEIACHVAFIDQVLVEHSSYAYPRMKELAVITSTQMKEFIEQHKICLINYRDI